MPSVRVSERSQLPASVVLAAARDFSERRAELWPDVYAEHLEVHETGPDYAVVTEGNPWPIGQVWETVRYDWSDPRALRCRRKARAVAISRADGIPWPDTSPIRTANFRSPSSLLSK